MYSMKTSAARATVYAIIVAELSDRASRTDRALVATVLTGDPNGLVLALEDEVISLA